jgi:gluconokinase
MPAAHHHTSTDAHGARALVVMGVAGSGKSTIGVRLAAELGAEFLDADVFHPPANVLKMRDGVALTDADRAGWLLQLRSELDQRLARGQSVVLACSALKAQYRIVLGLDQPARSLIFLSISPDVVAARIQARADHFMPSSLVSSQFAALEAPSEAIVVDATLPIEAIVSGLVSRLRRENP